MPEASSHPHGEVFLDPRGQGRALRLTWHHEADVVVLSLWRDRLCAGTFRLSKGDVNDFVDALVDGLREVAPTGAHPQRRAAETGEVRITEVPANPSVSGFTDWAFGDDPGRASA